MVCYKFFVPQFFSQRLRTTLAVSCGPLSDNRTAGTPCFGIQVSLKAVTTSGTSAFVSAIGSAQREKWSINTSINAFPIFVFGSGPNKSIATTAPGQPLGKARNGIPFVVAFSCLQHCMHVLITFCTSVGILPHIYLCLNSARVLS